MNSHSNAPCGNSVERGQVAIFLVLAIVFVLLGFLSLAVDYSNAWSHRQAVQSAADATCQAAAMDLLLYAQNEPTPTMNFTPQLEGMLDCANIPSAAPCIIAKYNGYNGSISTNKVVLTFPRTIPGLTPPSSSWVSVPNVRVDVTEQVNRYFSGVFSRSSIPVHASASCGLVAPPGPVPIIALHPTASQAISMSGTQNSIAVIGGPQTSIQVNSKSLTAVTAGSLQSIDLSRAGPLKSGGDFAVFGGAANKPYSVNVGTTGNWDYPIPPIADPYQSVSAPVQPANNGNSFQVDYAQDGCPDISGCIEYSPGYYRNGITIKSPNPTAIFQPGLYYIGGNGLNLQSNSIVRVTCCGGRADGDGSGGITFYFSGSATLSVDSNSGKAGRVDVYHRDGGTYNGVQSRALRCPSGIANEPEIPETIDGNVLLAPCSGDLGDPSGQYRGFLFFQDRAAAATPSWQGGGSTLAAGFMYFHQCRPDGTGLHCSAPAAGGYGTTFNMGGNPGSGSYAVGSLVTDQIVSNGNPGISMILNKNKYYPQLKIAF